VLAAFTFGKQEVKLTRISHAQASTVLDTKLVYVSHASCECSRSPSLVAGVLAGCEALSVRAVYRVERSVDVAERVEQAAHDDTILLIGLRNGVVFRGRVPSSWADGDDSGFGRREEYAVGLLEVFVEMVGALGVAQLNDGR
jgi:hypothetical protein